MAQYLTPDMDGFIPMNVAMFGKRYVKRWQQSVKQYRTYDFWRQLFISAALARYEWEGLPVGIDPRFLEMQLLFYGSFALTKRADSPVAPYWAARFTPQGMADLYGNPNEIRLISMNGYQQVRHANYWIDRKGSNQHKRRAVVMPPDAAVCWDNLLRAPILQYLDGQAMRLAEMDTTVDQHSRALRVPYVIIVTEGSEKNAQDLYNKIAEGQPAIYQYRSGPAAVPFSVAPTMPSNAYAGDKLLNDELKIVASVYTMLGIDNNAAAEKKERVQTAETVANNEQFLLQRKSFTAARRNFCNACRDVLGLDVNVKWAVPHMPDTAADTDEFDADGMGATDGRDF